MKTENEIDQEQIPNEEMDKSLFGNSNNISKNFISFLCLIIVFLIIMGIFIYFLY